MMVLYMINELKTQGIGLFDIFYCQCGKGEVCTSISNQPQQKNLPAL